MPSRRANRIRRRQQVSQARGPWRFRERPARSKSGPAKRHGTKLSRSREDKGPRAEVHFLRRRKRRFYDDGWCFVRWGRGRRDRFHGDHAEALRDVARIGLAGGLSPLVPPLAALHVQEERHGPGEPTDREESLDVVRRPGSPGLPERFHVDPRIGQGPEDRHDPEGDAEEDEDGPGGPEGTSLRRLLVPGVPQPRPSGHVAAAHGPHKECGDSDGVEYSPWRRYKRQ